jgi:hypothetical protein
LVGDKKESKSVSCEHYFSPLEWKLMWTKTELSSIPKKPPSMYWAYYALAKLGRWYDSKGTGIVGWEALWDGWFTLTKSIFRRSKIHAKADRENVIKRQILIQGEWSTI